MAITARYRFVGSDMGLLALAFPRRRVLKGPIFEPFIPNKEIIVVSEDPNFSRYPDKDIIQIISTAEIAVDTRVGFLRILGTQGVKAENDQVRTLLTHFSDEEFWIAAKLATVLKCFPTVPLEPIDRKQGPMMRLFDALFEDALGTIWFTYWELRKSLSTDMILCAVMEMMCKAKRPDEAKVSYYYRQILKKNHRCFPIFRSALNDFITQTQRDDLDLLGFFACCSAHTRPPIYPWLRSKPV